MQGVLLMWWLLRSLGFNPPSSTPLSRLIGEAHQASGGTWLENGTCFKALSFEELHCPFFLTSPVRSWNSQDGLHSPSLVVHTWAWSS